MQHTYLLDSATARLQQVKMENYLDRNEKQQLLQLLEVTTQSFNNIPIMKSAFKRACKKHHPDKGGDNSKMMLLNSLWHKYQEGVIHLRSFPEVRPGTMDLWDFS
uniref:DnaJ domain protein n=1 Tax=Myotis daubentonii polyomavirus TaxID=3139990 RepID=A0AAU6S4Z2_9POLY